jgi:hypothetical protein
MAYPDKRIHGDRIMDKSTFYTIEDIAKDWTDTFTISTAIRERDEYIKELEQIKFKYEFGKHFDQIHSFLFEMDFWEITELIGEEFDRKISFKSKNGHFVLNCILDGNTEIYKIRKFDKADYLVECDFDKIFSELGKLEK